MSFLMLLLLIHQFQVPPLPLYLVPLILLLIVFLLLLLLPVLFLSPPSVVTVAAIAFAVIIAADRKSVV